MTNQFISLEMIAELEQAAQNGCLYSQAQLKVWKEPTQEPSYDSNSRPCSCGSGQSWVNCSANSSYCG